MKIRVLKALRSTATRVPKPICPGVLSSTECSWGNIALSYELGKRQEIVGFVSVTVVFMILRFLPFVFQLQASGLRKGW